MTIMTFRTTTGLAMLGAVALTTLTAQAVSAGEATHRTMAVPYSDLDLSTSKGRELLDGRLARAARQVCSGGDWRDLRAQAEASGCRAKATAAADQARDQAVLAQRRTNEMVAARAPLP